MTDSPRMLSKGHKAGVENTAKLFDSILRAVFAYRGGGVPWRTISHTPWEVCRCGPHRKCKELHHLLPRPPSLLHQHCHVQNVILHCTLFDFIHFYPGQGHH